jgi:2-dehydropantoate 2-reductase
MNLGNAVEAVCGPVGTEQLLTLVRAEGEAVLRAAGISFTPWSEDQARRGEVVQITTIEGAPRYGSSASQSLSRATGSIEADYLNGEICLLGRLNGIPTPANSLFQRLANRAARRGDAPGSSRSRIDSLLEQLAGAK